MVTSLISRKICHKEEQEVARNFAQNIAENVTLRVAANEITMSDNLGKNRFGLASVDFQTLGHSRFARVLVLPFCSCA